MIFTQKSIKLPSTRTCPCSARSSRSFRMPSKADINVRMSIPQDSPSGTLVHLYGADGSGTNYTQRNFIMGLGAMDERGGITFTIFPAHVKGFSRVLNASGGRSYLEQAARNRTTPSSTQTLQLYGMTIQSPVDSGSQRVSIRTAGTTLSATLPASHSTEPTARPAKEPSSDCIPTVFTPEWSNEAHKWRIEEVVLQGHDLARCRACRSPVRRSLSSTRQRHAPL